MQVDKENKKGPASYLSFPNTTQSFNRFSKLEIARDIKENICKILVEKTEEM